GTYEMKFTFTKMQALGNDFVVIDSIRQTFTPTSELVRALADRRRGVGCDQVLVLEKAEDAADFIYRIFNADGTEVGQCGNGARCAAEFLYAQGLTTKRRLVLATRDGRHLLVELNQNENPRVNLG